VKPPDSPLNQADIRILVFNYSITILYIVLAVVILTYLFLIDICANKKLEMYLIFHINTWRFNIEACCHLVVADQGVRMQQMTCEDGSYCCTTGDAAASSSALRKGVRSE
jgi:hypothetical protein